MTSVPTNLPQEDDPSQSQSLLWSFNPSPLFPPEMMPTMSFSSSNNSTISSLATNLASELHTGSPKQVRRRDLGEPLPSPSPKRPKLDFSRCTSCKNAVFATEAEFIQHVNHPKHAKKVLQLSRRATQLQQQRERHQEQLQKQREFFCDICKKGCLTQASFDDHNLSRRHLQLVEVARNGPLRCEVCDMVFKNESLRSTHLNGKRHLMMVRRQTPLLLSPSASMSSATTSTSSSSF